MKRRRDTVRQTPELLDDLPGDRLTGDGFGYGRDITGALPFGFCGGAALPRTDVLRAAGGVAGSLFCYYEDTDTSWRLRLAGYQVLAVPGARVRHLGGASARHGAPAFHRWNERNRLLVLLRCAPAGEPATLTSPPSAHSAGSAGLFGPPKPR